ncbi:uncharacterized protein LOC143146094 [Ptiloglossa arizonensis]|uniref:uncharacterized protein LOC143146094 n=1 Tax=Ptiloglossa arizonensis TaxID=3350558 RepID=UPI003FA0F64A
MQTVRDSIDISTNQFKHTDQATENIVRNDDETVNSTRTELMNQNIPSQKSTQTSSKEKRKRKKRNAVTDSVSNSSTGRVQKSLGGCFRWFTQCCRKHKAKEAPKKKRKSLWKCLKQKREKCREKKRRKRISSGNLTVSNTSTAENPRSVGSKRKRHKRAGKTAKFEDAQVDTQTNPTDHDEKLMADEIPKENVADFTKSCCYLCAQNTMAIAAAIANKVEKSNISIQVSAYFERKSTSVKNSSAPHLRTVQSSVKVKMHDMGTLYPEEKKPKKAKGKFKMKKLNNILPKLKVQKQPKVQTVGCGTDKTRRVPQCRAKRKPNCVRENK